MEDYRFFKKREGTPSMQSSGKKSKNRQTHVAMFSDFFNKIPKNMFCTNAQYAEFKQELINTIEVFNVKEKITVELYETTPSDDEIREVVLIGFRNYIRSCRSKLRRQYMTRMIKLSLLALLGIMLVYVIHKIIPGVIPEWLRICFDNVSGVLLWQFIGFWAFEYVSLKREADQLKQIESIEYNFKLWE